MSWIELISRKMWPTSDDWSPNFPKNCVEFRVYLYQKPRNLIRVCVSGADDTGMERDEHFPMGGYEARLKEIEYWLEHKIPNPVTQEWLLQQGFKFW